MNWQNKISSWIEENDFFINKLFDDLISIKSINPKFIENPSDSETELLQDLIEQFFKDNDVNTDRWEVYPNQSNVIGIISGKSQNNSLILNGHIDVVPPGNISNWESDPFDPKRINGKVFGRGTGDMKSGVLCNILVAKFIKDMKIDLNYDLQFHVVVDEEGGGAGTRAALEKGYKGAAVIVTEPTNEEILPVEGGLQWVRVKLKGHSAHAGWRYEHIYPGDNKSNGVNVIDKAVLLLNAIKELEREWGRDKFHPLLPPGIATINPGVMLAGVGEKDGFPEEFKNPATIPDYCSIDFDLKYLPTEKTEDIKAEFEKFISNFSNNDSWLRNNPPIIEWGLYGVDFAPVNTDLDHQLVKILKSSRDEFNLNSKLNGMVAVTDAAFYSEYNIPSVIYGPISDKFHGPNEYVEWESVTNVLKTLILTVLKWNEM